MESNSKVDNPANYAYIFSSGGTISQTRPGGQLSDIGKANNAHRESGGIYGINRNATCRIKVRGPIRSLVRIRRILHHSNALVVTEITYIYYLQPYNS